ncbi:MAG: uracil-DNA glycosylase [Kiritimatiellae bacterium]|nr:uracil-DNA glycosylase [Kiritimatiellia bacterium]
MSHGKNVQQQLFDITEKLGEYIRFQNEEGLRTVEVDRELVRELGRPASLPAAPAAPLSNPSPSAPRAAPPAGGSLEDIAARVRVCTICPLHKGRTKAVPGQGAARPEIAFVGEGPGADEDRQGIAFIGRAGQLLTKIIEAMGFTRDQVWIGNIVKCRPPENRVPLPEEMAACLPYLKQQLALLQPKVIVCLGATAVKGLLNMQTGITKLRGTWLSFEGIDVMPTFHPAYLLRNPGGKREVWEDMKAVLEHLGREPPKKKSS